MNRPHLETPFIWPDSRRLASTPGPAPDVEALLGKAQLILGVVHDISEVGVKRLALLMVRDGRGHHDLGGVSPESFNRLKVRLIVNLYPTCPTTSDVLLSLLELQVSHPSLEVRLTTCGLRSAPENALACYEGNDALPTVLFGSAANLEEAKAEETHLTLAFSPEPLLAAEWQKWFDVRWLKAARLNEARTNIPALVLPEGTLEATRQWEGYEQALVDPQQNEKPVNVTVDPATGEIIATAADGTPVATVSAENKLLKVSAVYRKLAQLMDMGHLVSVDKTTRLLPFEVSVKPKWFGLETLKQIGSVKRQVSYRISALSDDELKQLENRRKKTSELLTIFSFSLADGQRWMPKAAEELFRQENNRINKDAKDILSKLVGGDLDKFMAERRKSVSDDANRMYRDLFPDKRLSEDALSEIMDALKRRFEEAQHRSFLPELSFNRVSLPQPQESTWKSQLGSALNLLLTIVRYPRSACKNGTYFARGMSAKPQIILKAMNLLNDPFVEVIDRFESKDRAESELEQVDAIEASEDSPEEKCRKLFELLGHNVSPSNSSGEESAMNDDVWYFAYGSNLWIEQKEQRTGVIRTDEDRPRMATLANFRLAFNKSSSRWGSAANIVPCQDGLVFGVIYRCDAVAMKLMDGNEVGYDRHTVTVALEDGSKVQAVTYVAMPKYVVEGIRPSDEYVKSILTGASQHNLPPFYIEKIKQLARGDS